MRAAGRRGGGWFAAAEARAIAGHHPAHPGEPVQDDDQDADDKVCGGVEAEHRR